MCNFKTTSLLSPPELPFSFPRVPTSPRFSKPELGVVLNLKVPTSLLAPPELPFSFPEIPASPEFNVQIQGLSINPKIPTLTPPLPSGSIGLSFPSVPKLPNLSTPCPLKA